MCAGLPLCEMNRLKAIIKASDVRSLTNSRWTFVTKHTKSETYALWLCAFRRFPSQERPGIVYTAARERSRDVNGLAGNKPIEASDLLGLGSLKPLKQIIHFCIIPRTMDRKDSGQKRWCTKAIMAYKPAYKFRLCSRSIIRWVNMCLRGRRIGWHALNTRFEFFNLPPTRIPLSSKKGDNDKILLEAFTISFLTSAWYSR